MSEKTLKFNNIRLNKKEFHKSKQEIDLMSVNVEHIVTSEKFIHIAECFKYLIGYQDKKIVKALCIILTQMSGYIENMSFMIKDDSVLNKYNKFRTKLKKSST